MAVITISRQFGAGGRTLGEKLSKRLGYRYVHEEMIKELADKMHISDRQVRDFEKRGTTKLLKFIDKFVTTSYVERLISDTYGYVDEKIYVDAVKAIVQGLYDAGNVVIVGRGGQFILKDHENTLHTLLIGDLEHRTRFLIDSYYLKESEAEKAIRRADQIRHRFLTFFADAELHDDPLSYDMTFRMDRLDMNKVEEVTAAWVS